MVEVIGIVEKGQIKLPSTIHLLEGQSVRVLLESSYPMAPLEDEEWTEEEIRLEVNQATINGANSLKPEDYPREGEDWTEEEMQRELDWATGKQFQQ